MPSSPTFRSAMNIPVIDPSLPFLQAGRNFVGALPECGCRIAASLQDALRLEAARQEQRA